MELERQNKVKNILQNREELLEQLKEITEEFKKDQFHVIKDLEDALLEDGSQEQYDQYSTILLSLIMKQSSNDKYRVEQTYTKLYQHYLKSESSSHLILPLTHLLNYFPQHIYLEGDKVLAQLISHDFNKTERLLNLLKVACRPLKNQMSSFDLNSEKLNTIQNPILDFVEVHSAVDGLIKIAEKTVMTDKIKKSKGHKELEMVDSLKEDRLKQLALNILLLLRNILSKPQNKKVNLLLRNNVNEIEKICDNDKDLMVDYLYFLFINKEDFNKGKEILVFEKMSLIINEYMKTIMIKDCLYTINQTEKWPYSQKLLDYQQLFLQIDANQHKQYINLPKFKEIYSNQDRFLICKSTFYEITIKVFFVQLRSKAKDNDLKVLFEIVLSLSKLVFGTILDNKENPDYDVELSSNLKGFYEYICEEKKNQFLEFIYQKLVQLDKKAEINEEKKIRFLTDREDKFTAIGCYLILEFLSSKLVEDMKGYSIKFMNFIKNDLYDDYLFTYVATFLAEMANYFTSNITSYHQNFMPQLISILYSTKNVYQRYCITDAFSKLYDQLTFQRIKEMYPYLKEILSFLVQEYTSNDFFLQENYYTESIQQLINQLINLKDVEFYIKDQILESVDIFIKMALDPNKRKLLISKNHQLCLLGYLKIQMRLNNVNDELLQQIKSITKELALKIKDQGQSMTIEEKIMIYQYFKKLTAKILGSQSFFEEIFLLILPQAIKDAKTDVSIKNYTVKENDREEIQYEDENEDQMEDEQEIDEDLEQIQLQYFNPPEDKVDLVRQSLTVITVLCEESPEVLMNHKKFEIIKIISEIQCDSDLTEDLIISCQSVVGRIFATVQKYLIEQENGIIQDEEQGENVGLSADIMVEMDPLIQLLFYRFQHHSQHIIVKQCEDRLFQELYNTIEKIHKKTIYSYFNYFYLQGEQTLYSNIGTQNSNQIGNGVFIITLLLQAIPSKIMVYFPQTWDIVRKILTEEVEPQEDYTTYLFNRKQQQEIKMMQESTQNEKKEKEEGNITIVADPFVVIRCISEIYELLKFDPNIFQIINPVFHHLVTNEDFTVYEQYLQHICEYLKKIIRYSLQHVKKEDIFTYYRILQKLVKKIDEDYYSEISPVENLRLAYAMLGTYVQKIKQEESKQCDCFTLLLEVVPLRDEVQEFPFVLYVAHFLVINDYELNSIQKNNIMKSVLRAIENPGSTGASPQDLRNCYNLLEMLIVKDPANKTMLLKNIQSEILISPKENLMKALNLE